MNKLSDAKLRVLKSRGKPYKVADGHGLYIHVSLTGAKCWRYRYRIAGHENIFSIGEYPEISLSEARAHHLAARKLVQQGIHPTRHRRAHRIKLLAEQSNTFENVAQEWIKERLADRVPAYIAAVRSGFKEYIFPHVGALPVGQITSAEMLAVLKSAEKSAPATARRLRQWCSAVFRYAVVTMRADQDPTAALKGALRPPKTVHYQALSREELPAFLKALSAYADRKVAIYIHLLLLTFVRASELRCACWNEFDLNINEWQIPADRMKMKELHKVPLSSQAITLLKELHIQTGRLEQLFPHAREPRQPMRQGTPRDALKRMGFLNQTTLHGFRALAATALSEMGFRPDALERQLAHRERNKTKAAYQRSEYIAERQQMMQAWADQLDVIAKGAAVVPLFGRTKRT